MGMMNKALKNLGLVVTLSGAALTALNIYPYNVYLLNLGAVFYLAWSLRVRDWNLVAVNGGLLLIYCLGLLIKSYI